MIHGWKSVRRSHRRRNNRTRPAAGLALVVAAALLLPATWPTDASASSGRTSGSSGGIAGGGPQPRTTPGAISAAATTSSYAYYLVAANGKVSPFGGAGYYGDASKTHLNAPIVSIAPTPDGKGYWLAAQDGGVFTYGDAKFYGSLGGTAEQPGHEIISIKSSPDGKGYWLCDAAGIITPFGDAAALPSLKPRPNRAPIVGFAVAPKAIGGWLVSSRGVIFRLGAAVNYGSLKHTTLHSPIVTMARSHSGLGYWLTNAKGRVWAFGDARPVARPPTLTAPVVSMSAAPAIAGYWAASADGNVIAAGVPSQGGLTGLAGSEAIVAITSAVVVPKPTYASGDIGYDVNWPQCASTTSSSVGSLPGPPKDPSGSMAYSVAVVGVDGWAVDDYNPCLAGEAKWAQQAKPDSGSTTAPPYELYLFLNSPASTSTIDQTGPGGTCANLSGSAKANCLAYNYGYNSALGAVTYATSKGASSSIWWLDIENDTCAPGEWNDSGAGEWWSCTQSLNDLTIQGALDGLRHDKVTAGIYSTSVQWQGITGGFTPKGPAVPLWVAGAVWTSPPYPASYGYISPANLAPWCKGKYDFAGGTPTLLQETPGSNNYPFDPDYAC